MESESPKLILSRRQPQNTRLVAANLQNAMLARADLQGAGLRDANLNAADLNGANLQNADLSNVDLQNADLRSANLQDANVTGVKFSRDALQSNFQGIRVASCYGSQKFKSFAQDRDYLEELRGSGRWGWIKFWTWYFSSNCGRSLLLWAVWSGVILGFFAVIYWILGPDSFNLDPRYKFDLITVVYHSVATFFPSDRET